MENEEGWKLALTKKPTDLIVIAEGDPVTTPVMVPSTTFSMSGCSGAAPCATCQSE